MGSGLVAQNFAGGGEIPGYSPHAKADNIPIWATAREFMQPVASVDYYGTGIMEAIRRRMIPRDVLSGWSFPGYPSGFALAGGGSVAAGHGSYSIAVGPINISGLDNSRALARTLQGEIERTAIRVMREHMN